MNYLEAFLKPEYGISGLLLVVIVMMRIQDLKAHKEKSHMFQRMLEKKDKELSNLIKKLILALEGLKKKK